MIETPKNEKIWVQYVKSEVVTHVITSDIRREMYYLYKVKDNKLYKTRYKSTDPTELEAKIK